MKPKSPLHSKTFYRVKNPKRHFLCALCSAPRQMKYFKNLSGKNYLQILLMATGASWAFFPLMGVKSLCLIFPIWMMMEIANKLLYRKDIPCPYCGFDATWYRRDVKVANKMVKDFWKTNYPELVETKGEKLMNPASGTSEGASITLEDTEAELDPTPINNQNEAELHNPTI